MQNEDSYAEEQDYAEEDDDDNYVDADEDEEEIDEYIEEEHEMTLDEFLAASKAARGFDFLKHARQGNGKSLKEIFPKLLEKGITLTPKEAK